MGTKRCYGCMRFKTQSPLCEHCGFNENVENLPHQLPLGTILKEQYMVGKVLGQGGFGITYMGWDRNLEIPIAIKEYYPNGVVSRECTRSLSVTTGGEDSVAMFRNNRERFLREARALARLRDIPGVVRVQNFFQENNTAYIIMEYVAGVNLKTYVNMRRGSLTTADILNLLRPIMEALSTVHEIGLVHRDISPDNIMIQPNGSAKLLDFGAVREVLDADTDRNLSQSTEAILKHGFAPLEQYQKRGSLGPWTDVYALCATIYYCMTGRVPPDAPARLLEDAPLDWQGISGLNGKQIAALEQGMAILPKQRIASVAELNAQLFARSEAKPPEPEKKQEENRYASGTVALEDDTLSDYLSAAAAKTSYAEYSQSQKAEAAPVQEKAEPKKQTAPTSGSAGGSKPKFKPVWGIAIAVALAVALFAGLASGSPGADSKTASPGMSKTVSAGDPAKNAADPGMNTPGSEDPETLLAGDPDQVQSFRDGSRVEKYFDSSDNERCRIYYDADGDMAYRFEATYNQEGNLLTHLTYDANGTLINRQENRYNADGNILTSTTTLENGQLYQTTTYTYDANGNCTDIVSCAADGSVLYSGVSTYDAAGNKKTYVRTEKDGSTYEYTYGENGKTASYINRDKNGNISYSAAHTYNSDDLRIATTTYTPSGAVDSTSEVEYNADGKRVRETYYKASGSVSYWYEYSYDAYGVEIGQTYHSGSYTSYSEYVKSIAGDRVKSYSYGDGSEYSTDSINYYNAMGNMILSESFDKTGAKTGYSEYTYDAYGESLGHTYTYFSDDGGYTVTVYDGDYNQLSYTSYDASGTVKSATTYEYEFDSQGNITKQIGYDENGKMDSWREYLYDEGGVQIGERYASYYSDGSYTLYEYDADYNTLSSTSYDENGAVEDVTTYEYEFDSNGNKIKQIAYDESGNLKYWTEYFYDSDGNMIDSEFHNA